MNIPRLVLAGATSGVGKTTISCAIIHAMTKLGYSVQPFKVGPDYIDPSYLTEVSGNNTRNLDPWIMGNKELVKSFVTNSTSNVSLIEGVMGFYDGFSGKSNLASTHHVATLLKAPVILVLDASKTARSIAATAMGYKTFHKNSRISGIILNKIGSKKHELLCRQALESLKTPIFGCIPKNSNLSLESRHLGLIPIIEQKQLLKKIRNLASNISDFLNIHEIIKLSKQTSKLPKVSTQKQKRPKTTIAIALDNSFNFYYPDNFDALRREGAKIVFFSPISDKNIPRCNGIFIGGGFPEILANSLEKNRKIQQSIKKLAEDNLPIYAECGGLMYLTKSISYGNKKHKMVGIFDCETKMTKKMKLNYTKGTILSKSLISSAPQKLRGHEFHYSEINSIPKDSKFIYQLSIGEGIQNKKDGLTEFNTLASYGHLYFDSSNYARNFIGNCINYSRR